MTSDSLADGRPRLCFLHGVRALAALAVVLFHLTLNTAPDSAGPVIRAINVPLLHGYLAVPVFLVLSGFLLAMPVVTNGLTLRGGVRGFLRRRALRVLPPYYAAYLLDMLFFTTANRVASLAGFDPGHAVHQQMEFGYRWPGVVAHLCLVHNMSHEWNRGMDANLWSIACEWQIYLLFAVALVPLWRLAGLAAMLAACAALATVLMMHCGGGACCYLVPSMIPAFGIGVAGAGVVFGPGPRATALRSWPWGVVTLAAWLAACAGTALLDASVPAEAIRMPVPYYHVTGHFRCVYDGLAALATASLIVWLALGWRDGDAPPGVSARLRGLLESRPLRTIAGFSYSLYLTHGPVNLFVARATQRLWPWWGIHWAAMMIGGTLLCLSAGYVFHRCFERPFMSAEQGAPMLRRRLRVPRDDGGSRGGRHGTP